MGSHIAICAVERLADALSAAVHDDNFAHRARGLSHVLNSDDGAGEVAAALGQFA
jgi:hypothetical protein